jgi:hypothetical protein
MLPEVAVWDMPARARGRLSPLGTCAAELAAVVRVAASPNSNGTAAVMGAGPAAASWANARTIDSGSQLAVGWRSPTSMSRPSAVGRCPGSLARQRSISGRTSAGT